MMPPTVLILRTFALLLLTPAVLFLSGQAATGKGPLKMQSLDFYYKLDQAARFLELKTQWQAEHRGEVPLAQAKLFALEADHASDMDTPLTRWRYQGGPSPYIFSAKAHVYGTGEKALLNVPFRVTVRAKVGNLRVIPALQLTDFETLQRTACWEVVSEHTVRVPAIAAGEDVLLPLMEFELLDFLQHHPNQFPVQVEVRLSSPSLGLAVKSLSLAPDHFVVPLYF